MLKEESKAVLKFNGHDHKVQSIRGKLSTAPIIKVKPADMVLDSPLFKAVFDVFTEHANAEPVFYLHDKKYHVVFGQKTVEERLGKNVGELQGKLLSSIALKQCRIIEPSQQVETEVRPSTPDFENRPRFVDNSGKRSYPRNNPGGGPRTWPNRNS